MHMCIQNCEHLASNKLEIHNQVLVFISYSIKPLNSTVAAKRLLSILRCKDYIPEELKNL